MDRLDRLLGSFKLSYLFHILGYMHSYLLAIHCLSIWYLYLSSPSLLLYNNFIIYRPRLHWRSTLHCTYIFITAFALRSHMPFFRRLKLNPFQFYMRLRFNTIGVNISEESILISMHLCFNKDFFNFHTLFVWMIHRHLVKTQGH